MNKMKLIKIFTVPGVCALLTLAGINEKKKKKTFRSRQDAINYIDGSLQDCGEGDILSPYPSCRNVSRYYLKKE
jgi:hypothetical protein